MSEFKSETQKFIKRLRAIIIFGFVWTFLLPSLVAYYDNVLKAEDMADKIPRESILFKKLQEYDDKVKIYKNVIENTDKKIDDILKNGANYNEIENLLKIKEFYEKRLTELKKPVKMVPFIESQTMYYQVVLTIFLSFCVFLINPKMEETGKGRLKWLVEKVFYALIIWIAIQFNSWGRCINAFDSQRDSIAFSHCDISKSSFWLQEVRVYVIALLLILLASLWINFYEKNIKRVENWDGSKGVSRFDVDEFANRTRYLMDMFNLWQKNIIVLIIAYIPWTFIHWNKQPESRFIISAIGLHFGWVVLWGIISAPMIYTFNKWTIYRFQYLAFLSSSKDNEKDKIISFVKESNPLSNVQIIGATLASIISLLLPIVTIFIK